MKSMKERLYERDLGRCRYCGCVLELWQATTDHVVPRKEGGRTTMANQVIACPRCNAIKGDRTVEEAGMRLWSVEEFKALFDGAQELFDVQMSDAPAEEGQRGGGAHEADDAQVSIVPIPPHWFDTWPYEQEDITVSEYDVLYRVYKNHQKARLLVENHIRGRRNLGLEIHPSLLAAETIYANLEDEARKSLGVMKTDPLWPAFEAIKGIDLVLAAGIRGLFDPWAFSNIQKAWKYAGYAVEEDGVGQRKRKGSKAGFSVPLKTRLWQAADSTMKQRDPTFRPLYDAMKEHAFAGLPEKKGQKGHAHNRAMRYVAKQIVKYLWCYAHQQPFSRPELDLPEDWKAPIIE